MVSTSSSPSSAASRQSSPNHYFSTPSPSSHHHHSRSTSSSSNHRSYRFLSCLSFLVAAQFLVLPATVHYYLSTAASQQQHPSPHQENDSAIRIRTGKDQLVSFPGDSFLLPRQKQHQQQQDRHEYDDWKKDYRDGTFNGAPLRLKTVTPTKEQPHTRIHCVGENYEESTSTKAAWQQRSCEFRNLFCFNTSSQEYVVFQSKAEHLLSTFLTQREYDMHASSTLIRYKDRHHDEDNSANTTSLMQPQTMSIGGINKKWGRGIKRLEWFPDIRSSPNTSWSYYELPPSVIMIPYHSLNGANPGHLIWDDYMPIYTLLDMFQKTRDNNQRYYYRPPRDLLLMRYMLRDRDAQGNLERGLWASCDMNENKTKACHAMMHKFVPLMLGYNTTLRWSTTQDFDFQPSATAVASDAPAAGSDLVCASTGLAGIGSLTDHGTSKLHGWEAADYKTTHNHGRGGLIFDFRSFMLNNLGFPREHESIHTWRRRIQRQQQQQQQGTLPPHRIVFSQKSSEVKNRNLEFTAQMEAVQKYIPQASVEAFVLKDLSVQEQMQVAVQSSIFVTLCGGGAVTGMFLPRGASVILYYDARGGAEANHLTGLPARLDWDLYNAMTHLRVHWLPKNTAKDAVDQMALVLLIRHELARIDEEAQDDEKL